MFKRLHQERPISFPNLNFIYTNIFLKKYLFELLAFFNETLFNDVMQLKIASENSIYF